MKLTSFIFILLISGSVLFPHTLVCQATAERLQSIQDSIQKHIYNDTPRAMKFAVKYDSMAAAQDSLFFRAKGKNFVGMIYYVLGKPSEAIDHYLESLKLFEQIDDDYFTAMLNNNLAAACQYRNDPLETINYYEQALAKFRILKDTTWIANVLNNISIQKGLLEDYKAELRYKQEAMEIYRETGNEALEMLTVGNMSDTYYMLGEYRKAKEAAEKYLSSAYPDNDLNHKATVLSSYGKILHRLGQSGLAKEALAEAIAISDELQLAEKGANAHQLMSMVMEENGDYREALEYHKEYKRLSDTLFNREKEARVARLLTEYNTEKKEQEIALLASQNKVKDLELSRAANLRWGLSLGLLVLGIALYFVFRAGRIKSRANRLLEQKNNQIKKALDEKNLLLREIHHRVKNNLQVISSLLNLQARFIADSKALEAIKEGRNRVNSMAILHQKLYQENNLTGIDVVDYFNNLIDHLFDSYNINPKRITLRKNIEPMQLDIDTVIPIGLIVNELISNALKHAFGENDRGVLEVNLYEREGELKLEVIDNGVGTTKETFLHNKSFGNNMVSSFVEKLRGEIDVRSEDGTAILVSFGRYKKVS